MVAESLPQAIAALAEFKPKRRWIRRFCRRSAVALLLHPQPGGRVDVLMIKRAERDGDPWSGHMAFPGGHMDADDDHTLAAAQRETWEEIGLDTEQYARPIGRLSDMMPLMWRMRRGPMVITPYVFELPTVPALSINHEVDRIVWVPLSFLADPANRESMSPPGRPKMKLPCYRWEQHVIWGVSLRILEELLDVMRRHPRVG